MNHELAWFYAPIAALLSQIGGTWWKPARRYVLPAGLALVLWWCDVPIWRAICCGISVGAAAHLPFTLSEYSWADWHQWVWVWILGYLLGAGCVFLEWYGLLWAFVPCVTFGVLGTTSNMPFINGLVPWKWFEAFAWMLVIYPYLILAGA